MNAKRFLEFAGRALVAFVACACLASPVLLRSQSPAGPRSREYVQGYEVVAGEVLVQFRADAFSRMSQIERDLDADGNRPIGDGAWRKIRSASRGTPTLLTALSSRADVLAVEPNYIVHSTVVPNDPLLPTWLWNLVNQTVPGADIHAANAWNVSTGSPNIVVGVIDSGIEFSHPDLAANIWSAPSAFTVNLAGGSVTCPAGSHGLNAITLSCIPGDDLGHGTHVAGTIGAVGNNGIGVVGVNWTTRMMGLKFLDAQGSGSTSDAVDAIDFAIQTKAAFAASNGANVRVLSNSWGGGGFSSALSQAIQRAANTDILFVAAAGNSNQNNDAAPFYPASYTNSNVIAVAATDNGDAKASFSNYGATSVDLGAPGAGIVSTYLNGGYTGLSGTSMATPHVSGAAALVLSACNLNTTQLKAAILNNVDVIPSMTGIVATNGRLNADKAIRSCASASGVSLTSPTAGAIFTAPATISLAATATDPGGINRVEFYQGSTLIGTSSTSPYGGTWNNVSAGTYTLTAKAYDSKELSTLSAPVQVTVNAPSGRTNVALAANGATAIASSTYASGFDASGTINGDRKGQSWGNGGGWNDGTPSAVPDWLEVDFAGAKTIDEVDVFSVQDTYAAPVEPTAGMTFTRYGVTAFTVQYWDGTQWLAVPNGVVTGNVLVWRQVTFAPLTTTRIRILVTGTADSWSRLTEVEAYQGSGPANTPPTVTLTGPAAGTTYTAPASITFTADAADADGTVKRVDFYENGTLVGSDTSGPYALTWVTSVTGPHTLTAVVTDNLDVATLSAPVQVTVNAPSGRTNVALASNGATAIASSTYANGYDASGAINGDRKGQSWGNGGGWTDATPGTWPDWFEIDFAGSKTIEEVDVFSVQDTYAAPVEPTAGMTFTRYGLISFTVQYWNGTQWLAVPGGIVSGNSLVWCQLTFAPLTTTKIRILVSGTGDSWSRVTEVEAYTPP